MTILFICSLAFMGIRLLDGRLLRCLGPVGDLASPLIPTDLEYCSSL